MAENQFVIGTGGRSTKTSSGVTEFDKIVQILLTCDIPFDIFNSVDIEDPKVTSDSEVLKSWLFPKGLTSPYCN